MVVRVLVVVVVVRTAALMLPRLVLSPVLFAPLVEEFQLLLLQPRQLASPTSLVLHPDLPVLLELLRPAVTPVEDALDVRLEREPLVLEEFTDSVGTVLNRLTGAVKLHLDAVTEGRGVELLVTIVITIAFFMVFMVFATRVSWSSRGGVGRRRRGLVATLGSGKGGDSEDDEETHGEESVRVCGECTCVWMSFICRR